MALTEAGPSGPPRFAVGGVIATSVALLFRNILRFLAIFVVIVAPAGGLLFLGGFVYTASGLGNADFSFTRWFSDPAMLVLFVYSAMVFLISYALALSALTQAALLALRGERVGIGACLGQSFRVLPRMLIAVLIFVAMLGAIAGAMGWMIFRTFDQDPTVGASPVAWLIATVVVALVLIALIVVLTWVFVPAVVAERAGPIACFRRSLTLTKGRRWAVLAIVILTALANGASSYLTTWIEQAGAPILGQGLDMAFNVLLSTLGVVLCAVGYTRLRGEKEGVVIEDAAKVFD